MAGPRMGGHGPRGPMMPGEKAKDFKGTLRQLIRTMSQAYPDLRSKVFGAIQRAPLDGWEKAR